MEWMCWVWEPHCNIDGIAAWVQAFGSIAAILVAPWLSRSADRQRMADNNKLVDIFLTDIEQTLATIATLAAKRNAGELNRISGKLFSAGDRYVVIDQRLLPYSAAEAMTKIHDAAHQVADFSRKISWAGDYDGLKDLVEKERINVNDASKTIRAAISPKKWWQRRHCA